MIFKAIGDVSHSNFNNIVIKLRVNEREIKRGGKKEFPLWPRELRT